MTDLCSNPTASKGDLRRCANCAAPLGVVGGKVAHVSAEQVAQDRARAEEAAKASRPTGLRSLIWQEQQEVAVDQDREPVRGAPGGHGEVGG